MKNFLNRINPLDYKVNPIGALKTELSFWIFGLLTIAPWIIYFVGPILIVVLGLFGWLRISYLISHYLEAKEGDK